MKWYALLYYNEIIATQRFEEPPSSVMEFDFMESCFDVSDYQISEIEIKLVST